MKYASILFALILINANLTAQTAINRDTGSITIHRISDASHPVTGGQSVRDDERPLAPPTDLSVDIVSSNDALLNWLPPEVNLSADLPETNNELLLSRPLRIGEIRLELMGYRVYRNDQMISQIDNPSITTYLDENLPFNWYTYYVTALYDEGESPPSNSVTIGGPPPGIFIDDFEFYPDFSVQFSPWTLIDLDGSATCGFNDHSFPGEYEPMSFIILNPAATTPPVTDLIPYSGNKMAASFAATQPPNNDWMITPQIALGQNSALSFRARSYSSDWNLERLRVGVSTNGTSPSDFTIITEPPYLEVPAAWNQYIFNISDWDEQGVWIAINCVSNDSWILLIDKFEVREMFDVVADPLFLPEPGSYNIGIYLEIASDTPDAGIYYTLDGTEPTLISTLYSEPVYLDTNMTVKVRAYKDDWAPSQIVTGEYTITTDTGDALQSPVTTLLHSPYPNPFNPETTISYTLAEDEGSMELLIYNIRGQLVRTLIPAVPHQRGEYQIVWDGKDDLGREVTSGIYFSKMTTPRYKKVYKMLLLVRNRRI